MQDERRAFERNKTTGSNVKGETQRQLESLQEELRKELEEKRRLENEEREKSAAWESEKKALEERLHNVRKQLRNAKDKLKEYRENEANPHILSRPSNSRLQRDSSLSHGRSSFDADMTIATPGAVRTTADPKRQIAVPGEKSAFSITPYLNRTKQTIDSPSTSDDDAHVKSDQEHRKPKSSKSSSRVDGSNENEKPAKNPNTKKRRKAKDLESDSESREAGNGGDGSLDEETSLPEPKGIPDLTTAKNPQEGKQNQKKRKLLGAQREKTLFDDDDDDVEQPIKEKRLNSALHSGIQALRASRFNGTSNFSPLKRDKRLI